MSPVARWEPRPARRGAWLARVRPLDWAFAGLLAVPMAPLYLLSSVARRGMTGRGLVRSLGTMSAYRPLLPGEVHPRAGKDLRKRLRDAYPKVVYPVRLILFREGAAYGRDEGMVSFESGRLVYEGEATAFTLRPAEAAVLPDAFNETVLVDAYDPEFRYGSLASRRAWAFDLAADPAVRVYLYALPVRGHDSLYPALYRWLFEPPEATGDSVLPPLDSRPGGEFSKLLGEKGAQR